MRNPASILVACGAVFLLVASGASIKSAGADTPQVVTLYGTPAKYAVNVQVDPAHPLAVTATVNVAGAADLPGNTATFSANNTCTSVLAAGEQSVGFHLNPGTLDGTLTAYVTQATGAVNCATAGTCTTVAFSSGATIVVTSPNPVKDVGVNLVGGIRQVEVCTTTYNSGSATGLVTATYVQAASSGGGGGTVNQGTAAASSAPWSTELSDGTSFYTGAKTGQLPSALDASGGVKTHEVGTAAVSGTFWQATQPVSLATAPALVASSATIGNVKITDGTNTAVVKAGSTLPAASDTAIVFTLRDALPGTQNVQGLGAANAPSGGAISCINPTGNTLPFPVKTFGSDTIAAVIPDNAATAALLNSACTSATACTSAQSIQWSMAGSQGATVTLTTSSSALGTALTCDASWDGGVTYALAGCDLWQLHGAYRKGALTNADAIAAATSPQPWIIYAPNSPSNIRIRMATFTSGSVTLAGRGTFAPNTPFPFWAKPQTPPTVVTLTSTTAETTLVAAGGTGVFLDLLDLSCSNSSTSSNVITVRDATGGTARKPIVCPAQVGPCEGWSFSGLLQQTTSNANWTVQAASSTASVLCTATAVQR